ncbi:hypothetical protein CCHR01_13269 [Colletotrichum chrysophilum]|uniref:Uncharacterized protein n=1 Tax=Colletotrichum chrysophilum TaxID=1836956 RepID=A0AAD9ABS2_9PEZI|nr:hypothetical protein CCHR01_13269 [Colletotrichum chrysophilum]
MGGPSYHLGLCLTASRRALDVGLGVGRWALGAGRCKIHHGAGGQMANHQWQTAPWLAILCCTMSRIGNAPGASIATSQPIRPPFVTSIKDLQRVGGISQVEGPRRAGLPRLTSAGQRFGVDGGTE